MLALANVYTRSMDKATSCCNLPVTIDVGGCSHKMLGHEATS